MAASNEPVDGSQDDFDTYSQGRSAPPAQRRDHHDDQDHNDGHDHAHKTGHSHGGPLGPTSSRVKKALAAIVIPLLLATIVGIIALWPDPSTGRKPLAGPSPSKGLIAATVTLVDVQKCDSEFEIDSGQVYCELISIRTSEGVPASFENSSVNGLNFKKGMSIYVDSYPITKADGTKVQRYSFYEFKRERPLLLLLFVFVLVAALVGRSRGIRALIALALSLMILALFMLPAIASGSSPMLVALVGASAVMFVALYLSHGINVRTTSAVIGTVVSLGITGLVAALAVGAANFTGLADEEANFLRATADGIDLRGLLLAGIIIGALGVLDDVTVTQSSAVWELHQANPTMGFTRLFQSAIRIGRDHIASAVNTLVLAYAGASLPLLLLFTNVGTPFGELFNGEPVATEVVRMLAGSIGLMASVPITTALTALVVTTADRPMPQPYLGDAAVYASPH